AAAARDPSCFRGLQFPQPNGPLSGFAIRTAADRLSGQRVAEAEHALGARIVAIDGATEIGRDDVVPAGAELFVYGRLDRLLASTPRRSMPAGPPSIEQRLRRRLRRSHGPTHRLDPYLIGFVITVLMLFAAGTWYFHDSFDTDWLTAAYFVMSTMTTTGFGDIFPDHSRALDLWATMVLMLLGTVFTGLFIVFAAARLTRAQWVRMQGLRPIYRRGHIVVCGSGSIGTGARARNPSMPIVLRIAEATFAESIARHFGLQTTFSVAALAGPVFAGLAHVPGARGQIAFGGGEFAIIETELSDGVEERLPPGSMALAAGEEDGRFRLIPDIAALDRGTRVLVLVPLAP